MFEAYKKEVTRPEEAHDVVRDDDHTDQTKLDAHEEESAYDVTAQGVELKDNEIEDSLSG